MILILFKYFFIINKYKILLILALSILIVIPLFQINQPITISVNPSVTPSVNSFINPFYVHKSTNVSNYTFALQKGTYFIELASASPFSIYFNATLSSNGKDVLNLFTNNFVFHGIIVDNTTLFTLTTYGNGRWLISEFAQDPNVNYTYTLNGTDAFVMVPQIGLFSTIKISLFSSSNYYYQIFDSLLRPLTSYVSSIYKSDIILNLKPSSGYDGIIFLVVNGTGPLNIYWIPYTTSNNSLPINIYILGIFLSLIILIMVIIILKSFLRNERRKNRRNLKNKKKR